MATAEANNNNKSRNLSIFDYGIVLGSAHLLGLLIERSQRNCLEEKLQEMKTIRKEDAKANDKVVAIFSSREQSWLTERNRLSSQIQSLAKQIHLFKSRTETVVENLKRRVTEAEAAFEEEEKKLHSSEERREVLVSSQRLLEAEIAKLEKDGDHKGRILSAMLRKSKVDSAEKETLAKELKIAKEWRRSKSNNNKKTFLLDEYQQPTEEFLTADIEHLQNWIHLEIGKQTSILEQRHYAEAEAFIEQMRLKDEQLADFRQRILCMEVESNKLREDNMKLESLLLDREEEMKSLKDRQANPDPPRNSYKEESRGSCPIMNSEAVQNLRERVVREIVIDSVPPVDPIFSESSSEELEEKGITLVTLYPREEIEEEESEESEGSSYNNTPMQNSSHKPATDFLIRNSSGKIDIHALGISYKIKRLKQQLLMLEKLSGIMHPNEYSSDTSKGFVIVSSLLNKQVKRFQSLEEKIDHLCTRMDENSQRNDKTKEHRKMLQGYLGETFQLQRYMVATGQKLMEIGNKISLSFGSRHGLEESAGFNVGQFADVIRTLFKEIQRGLELRIARIIGDIEGTLACNGILHM